MDPIKEAFLKIKQDIDQLKEEMKYLRKGLLELYDAQTQRPNSSVSQHTHSDSQENPNEQKKSLEVLKGGKRSFSKGNEGVQTDRQTGRQTDKSAEIPSFEGGDSFEQASEALASLETLKQEIRLKFKYLTTQEMLVFSALYSLQERPEDQKTQITYRELAQNLSLSESSIRDYVSKLIQKGIPIHKKRLQNKTILLEIDPNLAKIASLDTILRLREQ